MQLNRMPGLGRRLSPLSFLSRPAILTTRAAASSAAGAFLTPEQYGAKGDGSDASAAMNDSAFTALAAAANAAGGARIRLGRGAVYRIRSNISGLQTCMGFTGCKGLEIDFNGARIECNNAWNIGEGLRVITLWDVTHAEINAPHYEQLQNQTPLEAFDYGSRFIYVIDGTKHLRVWGVKQTGGATGLEVVRSGSFNPANRAAHLHIFGGEFNNLFYPQSFQRNGDYYTGLGIRCRNVGRCYFPYNVQQHRVVIDSSFGGWPTSGVSDAELAVVTLTGDGNILSDIELWYSNRGKQGGLSTVSLVHLEMQQGDGTANSGWMRNIQVMFDVDNQGGNPQPSLLKSAKHALGGSIDNTTRGYVMENVFFSGVARGYSSGVKVVDLFTAGEGDWSGETVRNIGFRDFTSDGNTAFDVDMAAVDNNFILENVEAVGHAINLANNAQNKLKLSNGVRFSNLQTGEFTVTPTWGQTAGTGPTLGNGSLIARAIRTGNLLTVMINLSMGSTTTYGDSAGDWTFQLPAPFNQNAVRAAVGSVRALDTGSAFRVGACRINTGSNLISCFGGIEAPVGVGWKGNTPFTWANGDSLELTITYQVL